MSQYRKKPVVIEATQWFKNGDHPDDNLPPRDKILAGEQTEGAVVRYFRNPDFSGTLTHHACGRIWNDHGWIDTLEGGHIVCPGDWIITGVAGERYPCKPDIFESTYDNEFVGLSTSRTELRLQRKGEYPGLKEDMVETGYICTYASGAEEAHFTHVSVERLKAFLSEQEAGNGSET